MSSGSGPPGGPTGPRYGAFQPPGAPGGQAYGDFRPRFERTPGPRWMASPPPGGPTTAPKAPRPVRPYEGPPSYRRTGFPRWGFPPVVWRAAPDPAPAERPVDPGPGLRRGIWLAVLAAAAALLAAGAEIWRFVLMLQGRTLVLDGSVVRASDILVAAAGILAPLTALLALVYAVPVLTRTNAAAARRHGRAPSRSLPAVAARVLVPVWNIYGAGQIVTEIDRMLPDRPDPARADADDAPASGQAGRPSRASTLTLCWWICWVVSAILVIVTLARGFGGSLQAIADTVELHIAVDLFAAVVAGLGAAIFSRFRRLLAPPKNQFENWIVQPPAPTRPLPATASTVAEPALPVAAEPAAS